MKGILFKPEMIKAIVEGSKTQTRRVIKPQPLGSYLPDSYVMEELKSIPKHTIKIHDIDDPTFLHIIPAPRYQVGEVVYIKEGWCLDLRGVEPDGFERLLKYRLDGKQIVIPKEEYGWFDKAEKKEKYAFLWRSPLFLKGIYARYFIKITDVRPERLQEITLEDIEAEGHNPFIYPDGSQELATAEAFRWYMDLWDSINPKYLWLSNPFVWVYTFNKGE